MYRSLHILIIDLLSKYGGGTVRTLKRTTRAVNIWRSVYGIPRRKRSTKFILSNIYIYQLCYIVSVGMSNLNHSEAFEQGLRSYRGLKVALVIFMKTVLNSVGIVASNSYFTTFKNLNKIDHSLWLIGLKNQLA